MDVCKCIVPLQHGGTLNDRRGRKSSREFPFRCCIYFSLTKNSYFLLIGGTLLSIHSEDEVNMLRNFVKYTQYVVFIGLYRHMKYDEEFVWADGSPVDFTLWNPNEPNNDKEQCVEMRTETMKWNDVTCYNQRGYICSIHKILSNSTTEVSYQSGCMSKLYFIQCYLKKNILIKSYF
ncbi:UNVERIFIED_CONTAM: Macrophage mannose receptor 1 [Trichonephila clavipes]